MFPGSVLDFLLNCKPMPLLIELSCVYNDPHVYVVQSGIARVKFNINWGYAISTFSPTMNLMPSLTEVGLGSGTVSKSF